MTEFDNALVWLSDELMKTQRRLDQGITLHPHEERQFKLMHCILVLYRMCEEEDGGHMGGYEEDGQH